MFLEPTSRSHFGALRLGTKEGLSEHARVSLEVVHLACEGNFVCCAPLVGLTLDAVLNMNRGCGFFEGQKWIGPQHTLQTRCGHEGDSTVKQK